jgi:predicted Rossmann-fold nucleotide-binding protein
VLYNSAYWSGLLEWIRATLVTNGTISPDDVGLLQVADDVEAIVDIIEQFEANRYSAAEE